MWLYIILGIAILVLFVGLFWFFDTLNKGRLRRNSPPKDSPAKDAPVATLTPAKIEITSNDLADELCSITDKVAESDSTPRERISGNRLCGTGRIRDYYERKWQSTNTSAPQNFDEYEEDEPQSQINHDDVRKLMAIRDLFDRK